MEFHDLVQGTKEWKEFRKKHLPASDLPAVAGVSKYVKRSELMHRYATGEEKEISPALQRLFDRGHATEDKARKILEEASGVTYTTPTVSNIYGDLKLSASLDGYSFEMNTIFEHKLWNERLAESIMLARQDDDLTYIDEQYLYQIQQQLMITGANNCLFVCSDGTKKNWQEVAIYPDKIIQGMILGYWEHFLSNLAQYNPDDYDTDKPASASIMELPALQVQAKGLVDNGTLNHYYNVGLEFIKKINTELETDNDYADAEAVVKFCTESEKNIARAKQEVVDKIDGLSEALAMMDEVSEGLRQKRLNLSKSVKARKDQIKADLIQEFVDKVGEENRPRLTKAIKSKRTLATMRDALEVEVGKITMEEPEEPVKSALLTALGEWSERNNINLKALHELEDILKTHAEVEL